MNTEQKLSYLRGVAYHKSLIPECYNRLLELWHLINPREGGRCRDCADENGICPTSGLPCDPHEAATATIKKLKEAHKEPVSPVFSLQQALDIWEAAEDYWCCDITEPTKYPNKTEYFKTKFNIEL